MPEKPIDQQIAEAYKESQEAMQENIRLRELEFSISIQRQAAHQKMLQADEKLWILRHKASSYNARGMEQ